MLKIITFYEKPGCAGNAKQKRLLAKHGFVLNCIDILSYKWDAKTLNAFFGDLEVPDIVNLSAPKIKSGEVDISTISKNELIKMMLQDPILIKRPLMEAKGNKVCGFDMARLKEIFGIDVDFDKSITECDINDNCGA